MNPGQTTVSNDAPQNAAAVKLLRIGDDDRPFTMPAASQPAHDVRWLHVLRRGLGHPTFCLRADRDGQLVGLLPLAHVRSALFGKFLVSLPYLNSAGVLHCADPIISEQLLDAAVRLADQLNVQYLELRHEVQHEHPNLTVSRTDKVHMRRALPDSVDKLWSDLKAKVRNQIRKGEKQAFSVQWGTHELLADFYDVFSRNMRDLGTPVFGKSLFVSTLDYFPDSAELCVVKLQGKPVAAALLVHGAGTTEVPSASSLRAYNATNANMFMYWQLLKRAVERRQQVFDFGRSSEDSNTYRFKRQWGAAASPAIWQYYVRRGEIGGMRPDSPKMQRAIQVWRKLPLAVTRWLGPPIVRGIP